MNLQNELCLGQLLQQPSFPISHSSSHHAPPYQLRLQKVEQFSLFQNIFFQQHPRRQTQWFQYIPLTLWFLFFYFVTAFFFKSGQKDRVILPWNHSHTSYNILKSFSHQSYIILKSSSSQSYIILKSFPHKVLTNNRVQRRFPSKFQNFSQLKYQSLRPHPLTHTVWTLV